MPSIHKPGLVKPGIPTLVLKFPLGEGFFVKIGGKELYAVFTRYAGGEATIIFQAPRDFDIVRSRVREREQGDGVGNV